MRTITTLSLGVALLLSACSDPTVPFVGTWRSPGTVLLAISQTGKSLVVQESLVGRETAYSTSPAKAEDNVLAVDKGSYVIKYIYMEANDTLVMSGGDSIVFRRVR
jgi:hypothetical protein